MHIREGIPNPLSLNLNTSSGGINKQTLNSSFAGKLRNAARETTLTAQRTANYVAPFVPGAAIVSAGLGSVANNLSVEGGPRAQVGGAGELTGPGGERGGDFLTTMQDMQQNMMSSNMQMLSVQRKFQQMSEHYLTASNILKTKHDTDKNSINNIR